MKNELWISPDLDLCTTLKEELYDSVIEYAEENQRQLLVKAKRNETEILKKSLKLGTAILRYQERVFKQEKSKLSIYKLGVLSGSIDALNQLIYDRDQKQQTIDNFKESIKCVKHLKKIISLLDLYGSLTHAEVSEKLNVNPPTLTEIMKKIIPTTLVNVTLSGKYKLYSLTDQGRQLALYVREIQSENDQLENLFEQLKKYSQETNDTERIRKYINNLLKELNGATIIPGEKISLDFRDIQKNQTHLELLIEKVNSNSDLTTNIKGSLTEQTVLPIKYEKLIEKENKRRAENENNRKVAAYVRNSIW
ncbi:MAG: hypothetical protein IKW03_02765 [Clostridia bacterium]|nr:hypothetical protein [Clostridia bacterium]